MTPLEPNEHSQLARPQGKRLSSHGNPKFKTWQLQGDIQMGTFWYCLMRRIFHVTVSTYGGVRVFNRCYEPTEGGVLYISNHQSFLDPILMSYALKRPMNYMARDTLFGSIFGPMIRTVNAFPVKRGTADTGALKEAMRRIKKNGQVVLFAEGTRTKDGRIAPLLPGAMLLAQRAAQWTVPVVIDGATECWPRWQPLPGPGSIVVQYGPPIPRQEAAAMKPDELAANLRRQMIAIQAEIRRRVGRPPLHYDE